MQRILNSTAKTKTTKNNYKIMKKMYTFLAACLLSIASWAVDDYKVGYTVFDSKTGTLTYYYDYNSKRKDVGGSVYDPTIERFKGYTQDIKKVVIDASFKDATTMQSTRNMFFSGNEDHLLINLTEIVGLQNLVMDNVITMEKMFYGCQSLKSVDVSSWNTAKVEDMNKMFEECWDLETLDLSNFNTQNVTDMSYMFAGCIALKAINVSSFNTQNVNCYNGMFMNCINLTILNISNFDVKSGCKVVEMFYGCEKLETIYCNDDWTTKDIDADDLFEGCESIVGGYSTTYDDNHTYLEYARPDKKETPGYFTTYAYDSRTVVSTCELEGFNVNSLPCMAKWSASREELVRYAIEPESGSARYRVIGSQLFRYNDKTEDYDLVEFGTKLLPGQYRYQVILSIEGDDALSSRFPNAKESKLTAKMDGKTWYAEKAEVFDPFSRVAINSPAIFIQKDEISEPESYAAFDESISTLTYYFDKNRYEHAEYEDVILLPWTDGAFYMENAEHIGRIVLDESFRNSTLTSSINLFHIFEGGHVFGLSNVGEINGLEYLNTKTMTDLSYLFALMEIIEEFDLTVLDLSQVTKTEGMFGACTNLKKILCDEDLSEVEESDDMFAGCVNLVGGNGTACDGENDIDADYARPDWKDQPGYFTATKPQGIETVQKSEARSQKMIENGVLYLMYNGTKYDVQGKKL